MKLPFLLAGLALTGACGGSAADWPLQCHAPPRKPAQWVPLSPTPTYPEGEAVPFTEASRLGYDDLDASSCTYRDASIMDTKIGFFVGRIYLNGTELAPSPVPVFAGLGLIDGLTILVTATFEEN